MSNMKIQIQFIWNPRDLAKLYLYSHYVMQRVAWNIYLFLSESFQKYPRNSVRSYSRTISEYLFSLSIRFYEHFFM